MNGCWPTSAQEQLLLACFAGEPAASRAVDFLSSSLGSGSLEPGLSGLLSLLYRRWPSIESELTLEGRKAYLALWRQNHERMRHLATLVTELKKLGIACLVLKGAALALRYYRDLGVRSMRDFDLLVAEQHLEPAMVRLQEMGYSAEGNYPVDAILRQTRVGHAWPFAASGLSCDLHWRPVARCYSPEVTRMFWDGAETSPLGEITVAVLCPTDQLFHVCAHGLQWDWTPPIRWIADALTVLREPIDWDRLFRLATESCMRMRLARALGYLQLRFDADVPPAIVERLEHTAPAWERREHGLLQTPCPRGTFDSVAWHAYHFRRLRPFDASWRDAPLWIGFPQYLEAFLGAKGWSEVAGKLWPKVKLRWRICDGQRVLARAVPAPEAPSSSTGPLVLK
jgi:hypothetical protein